jgi:DNA-binding transcriptional LysR family regulator
LKNHRCIVGNGVRVGSTWSLGLKGETIVEAVPRLTVNTVDATIAAAEAGLGLANLLSYQTAEAIAAGRLVRVLADDAPSPIPVSLLFEGGRAAMPAVRLFIEAMKARSRLQAWA